MQFRLVTRLAGLHAFALLALLAAAPIALAAQAARSQPAMPKGPLMIASQGYMFVGGQYTTTKNGQQIDHGRPDVCAVSNPPAAHAPLPDRHVKNNLQIAAFLQGWIQKNIR